MKRHLTKASPCQELRAKLERVEHELRAALLKLEAADAQLLANANSYDGLLSHLHEVEDEVNARAEAAERIAANRLETFLSVSDTLEKAAAAHRRAESESAALRAEVEHLRGEHLHPCGAKESELIALRAESDNLHKILDEEHAQVNALRAKNRAMQAELATETAHNDQLRDDLRAENERLRAEVGQRTGEIFETDAQLATANALLDQVRIHVTLNSLAAFEPKTEDQATNAGRFHVALYLLKQIHSVVFAAHLAGQPAAPTCPRTYPLDPNTAEDPCDDCGRDQQKHEIAP